MQDFVETSDALQYRHRFATAIGNWFYTSLQDVQQDYFPNDSEQDEIFKTVYQRVMYSNNG